ncbi:MAG: hypothetical protein RLZZ168_182, partial [Cyanobacteriota bacterium]
GHGELVEATITIELQLQGAVGLQV